MSYQKQNFANGEVLTASQLNHIEQGIVDLENNSSTEFAGKADKSEVQANAKSISAETTRAERAEQALDTRTAALESCGFVVVDGKVCMKYVKS